MSPAVNARVNSPSLSCSSPPQDNSWLEFAVADDLALHGECRMTVVRDSFFYTRFGIILQAGSPFRDALSAE